MRTVLPLLLLLAAPAHAVEVRYEAYAAGLNVVDVAASFDITDTRYRVSLAYRTVGGLGLVWRSRQETVVEGRFVGGRATPERFVSTGTLRGDPRSTVIDYPGGQPAVRQLVPPNEAEREPVPPEAQRDTIDTLSAMAELVRTVARTGRCDGQARTFDGRRLSALQATTAGPQVLEPTGRSSFSGMTLRCEFTGRQLGGFMLDQDRAELARPQMGTAWFAAVAPGGPMLPVRIAFRTRWFGDATMYVVKGG